MLEKIWENKKPDRRRALIGFLKMAPRDGFEPPAKRLTAACSTAELPGNRCSAKRHSECVLARVDAFILKKSSLSRPIFSFFEPLGSQRGACADKMLAVCGKKGRT